MARKEIDVDVGIAEANYWPGTDSVTFTTGIPHGAATRRLRIHIDPAVVIALGKALDREERERGHALWHLQHPDSPNPCSTCKPKDK